MLENVVIEKLCEFANKPDSMNKTAFYELATKKNVTYRELYKLMNNYTAKLNKLNIKNINAIVLNSHDIESIALILATMNSECIPIVKNYDNNITKLKYKLEELKKNKLNAIIISCFDINDDILLSNYEYININNDNSIVFDHSDVTDKNQYIIMQETSGTTGNSKIVPLNNNQIKRTLNCFEKCIDKNNFINFSYLPFSHILGLMTTIFLNIYVGGTTYLLKPNMFKKNVELWGKIIDEKKVSFIACSSFNLKQIILCDKFKECNLSSLKTLYVGGEPLEKKVIDDFVLKCNRYKLNLNCFVPSYGMTEMCGTVCHDTSRKIVFSSENLTSCGKLNESDVKILFLNNGIIFEPRNFTSGYILIASEYLFSYYLNYSETEQFIIYNNEKYFNTQDIGYVENEHLYVVGKINNILYKDGKKYSISIIRKIVDEINGKYNLLDYYFLNLDNKVIIVQEFDKMFDCNELQISAEYKRNIYNAIGLMVDDVIFIDKYNVPKTEIGKTKIKKLEENYRKGLIK